MTRTSRVAALALAAVAATARAGPLDVHSRKKVACPDLTALGFEGNTTVEAATLVTGGSLTIPYGERDTLALASSLRVGSPDSVTWSAASRSPEVAAIHRNRLCPPEADEDDGNRADDVQVGERVQCQTALQPSGRVPQAVGHPPMSEFVNCQRQEKNRNANCQVLDRRGEIDHTVPSSLQNNLETVLDPPRFVNCRLGAGLEDTRT